MVIAERKCFPIIDYFIELCKMGINKYIYSKKKKKKVDGGSAVLRPQVLEAFPAVNPGVLPGLGTAH